MKKSAFDFTLELIKDVCILIIEARTANKKNRNGREEGLHCREALLACKGHVCDPENNPQCGRLVELRDSLVLLLAERALTIHVDVVASGVHVEENRVTQGSADILLERWTLQIQSDSIRVGNRKLLLQAIHSHLHFSQLSAWLSSSKGHFPANISYRVNCDKKLEFVAGPDQHTFPISDIGDERSLVVVAKSLPRSTLNLPEPGRPLPVDANKAEHEEQDPEIKSGPKSPTHKPVSNCSKQLKQAMYAVPSVPVSVGGGNVCVLSASGTSRRLDSSLSDSGIGSPGLRGMTGAFSPIHRGDPVPRFSNTFSFDCDNSMGSDIYASHSSSRDPYPLTVSPTPYNSPEYPHCNPPYPWPLSEMLSPSSRPHLARPNFSPPHRSPPRIILPPRIVPSSPEPSFSACSSNSLESLSFSPIMFDSPVKSYSSPMKTEDFGGPKMTSFDSPVSLGVKSSGGRRTFSLSLEEEEEEEDPGPCSSIDDLRSSWHGDPFIDKPSFKRSTSLPLLSSPVLYRKPCSRAATGRRPNKLVNRSRNCLLGSFEESILKDRFPPAGSIPGFKYKMSVSGTFSSPPITLPFTGNFYTFSACPSPYTGCVKMNTCGTHGYQIPRKGRIQATVFDPEGAVIRIFLVPYDVGDMPPRAQTFLRQCIHAEEAGGKRSLLYHIHFKLMSGRSSRVYLHTEIRVLFVRGRSGVDTEVRSGPHAGPATHTDTCIPHNPRYSSLGKTKRSS